MELEDTLCTTSRHLLVGRWKVSLLTNGGSKVMEMVGVKIPANLLEEARAFQLHSQVACASWRRWCVL